MGLLDRRSLLVTQIVLDNVTKVFDEHVRAVSNANLEIAPQEFMVIVGPSGCGKTTVLRLIAGLEDVTDGTIHISGKLMNDIPPKHRDIAMVFQNYALYPHMTVYQNMAFNLKLKKVSKAQIKQKVHETAQMLGIETLLNRKPKALSGGQRQRVALGRAIVRHPRAFLFDEPLSNLDARLRMTMRAELKWLHRRLDTTSLYVTHDQAEAMTLGDRICIMLAGEIQQVDEPMKIYERPQNRFVAGFLGTPPMNFLNGLVRFQNEQVHFVVGEEQIGLPERMKEALIPYRDQEMVLGIRPEHLSPEPIGGPANSSIGCTVSIIEPLGDHMDVYLRTAQADQLIAKVNPHNEIQVHQPARIYLNSEQIHIFETGPTGRNVTL